MFEQAFFCLDSQSTDLVFPNYAMTLAACQSTKVQASKASHEAFATYLGEKKKHTSSQDPEAIKRSHIDFQRSTRYLKFLELCEQFLEPAIDQKLPIYVLMMQIALTDLQNRSTTFALFNAWLSLEPINALQFFDTLLDNLALKAQRLEEEGTQDKMDYLLIEIAGSRNIELLRKLINKPGLNFSKTGVNAAFVMAASNDDPVALHELDALNPEPMTVKNTFIQALQTESNQVLDFFKHYRKHKQLKKEVERAFNLAVDNDDFNKVAFFLHFTVNAPSIQAITDAMIRAWDLQQKDMANYLKAIHRRLVPSVDFLRTFGIFSPADLARATATPTPDDENEDENTHEHEDEDEDELCEPATPQ